MNHKKELLRSLWVGSTSLKRRPEAPDRRNQKLEALWPEAQSTLNPKPKNPKNPKL